MLAENVLLTSQSWELFRMILKPTKTTEGETEGDVVEEEEE